MRRRSSPQFLIIGVLLFLAVPVHAEDFLLRSNPKVQVAEQVYADLVHAIGDNRTPPEFRMVKGKSARFDVAMYSPARHTIYLEERFFDLSQSVLSQISSNALALILGHELAHFYRNHLSAEDFNKAFARRQTEEAAQEDRPSASPQRDLSSERRRLESEADYFAGFYSYLAGYRTLSVAPQVLDVIYERYEFNTQLPAYEHLKYRKETTQEAQRKLRTLIPMFDAGVYLLLIRDYDSAGRLFDRIAREFPSPEMFINGGVASALQAMQWFSEGDLRFAYPFEVDPDSRLKSQRGRAGEDLTDEERAARRQGLLSRAKSQFEKAASLSPASVTPLINVACVLDLQGQPEAAVMQANEAVARSQQQHLPISASHARVIRGIALVHSGQPQKAEEEFVAAASLGNRLATSNLAAMRNGETPLHPSTAVTNGPTLRPEQVGGVNIADIGFGDFAEKQGGTVMGRWDAVEQESLELNILTRQKGPVQALSVIRGSGRQRSVVFLLSAEPGSEGKTSVGLEPGQSVVEMERVYGPPTSVFLTGRGTYYGYQASYREDQLGIIFRVDGNQTLQDWIVYRIEK